MPAPEHLLVTELRKLILEDREDVAAMPTNGQLSEQVETHLARINARLQGVPDPASGRGYRRSFSQV